MGAKPEEEQAFTGDQALALLAQTVDPVEARRNPIDGAVVLAAMDAELEELEKAVAKQKEDQALLQQKKARADFGFLPPRRPIQLLHGATTLRHYAW